MCQLLGMNCNVPTDIVFSFEGFSKRGGLTDHHTDGFGIGFFEGKGARLFLDNQPSAHSLVAECVKNCRIKSKNVIAHIRKATQGGALLENTHPFMRELWGEYWFFAHNGHLKDFFPESQGYYQAVGSTDSERAFCYILEQLRMRFDKKPDNAILFAAVQELTEKICAYGLFNFLLCNGNLMFARACTLLFYVERKAPFGEASLLDDDVVVDFSKETTPNDRVVVVTTLPLTDNECWTQMAQRELLLFENGQIVQRYCPEQPSYLTKEEGLNIARSVGAAH